MIKVTCLLFYFFALSFPPQLYSMTFPNVLFCRVIYASKSILNYSAWLLAVKDGRFTIPLTFFLFYLPFKKKKLSSLFLSSGSVQFTLRFFAINCNLYNCSNCTVKYIQGSLTVFFFYSFPHYILMNWNFFSGSFPMKCT